MSENTLITNVTTANFEREVLQQSLKLPVLVDFWADWCQPCHMLAPVLEQLVTELKSKIKVVKINSDEEQQLAAAFGIRSLPTVKLFRNGEVINEFSGVIPLAAVREFIEPYLSRDSDQLLSEADTALSNNDPDTALSLLKNARESDPENVRIYPLLVEALIKRGDYDEAEQTIKSLPINIQQNEDISGLSARLEFARQADEVPGNVDTLKETLEKQPDNLDARYQLSALNVINGDYETAMENLLEIIRRDRSYRDDGGRKAILNIFEILGNQGSLVRKYRGLLSAVLN